MPDYVALLKVRLAVHLSSRLGPTLRTGLILLADAIVSVLIIIFLTGTIWETLDELFRSPTPFRFQTLFAILVRYTWNPANVWPEIRGRSAFGSHALLLYLPGLWPTLWLWLYVASGFLFKSARRLDIGFEWFNRKFDIKKKPLQSIGVVAGSLVAVVYWAVVIVTGVIG